MRGFVFLVLVAACALLIVVRIARQGPESGFPRCSTCSYTGCACDRPKTKTHPGQESPEENVDD